jgi:hypothetical protein
VAVKRIVSNIRSGDLGPAKSFYADIIGLHLVMDLGWIQTFAADASALSSRCVGTRKLNG